MGRCIETLTNHKKAVRSLVFHHTEYTFASAGADNIKVLLLSFLMLNLKIYYIIIIFNKRYGSALKVSLCEIFLAIMLL